MYLLEVYEHSVWSDPILYKRRIAERIESIEDWIDANAPKWSKLPVTIEHDGYGDGNIYLTGGSGKPMWTFHTYNVAKI